MHCMTRIPSIVLHSEILSAIKAAKKHNIYIPPKINGSDALESYDKYNITNHLTTMTNVKYRSNCEIEIRLSVNKIE